MQFKSVFEFAFRLVDSVQFCVQFIHAAAWANFLFFFGRGTGPKRSGAVLACFWSDFQPEPSILDLIRTVFDDLARADILAGLGQARDWPGGLGTSPGTGREALAQPILFFLTKNKKPGFFIFGGVSATPL